MNFIRCCVVIIVLCVGSEAFGQTGSDEAKDLATQLLNKVGTGRLGVQVMNEMISGFKTSMPDVSVEFWDECVQEFRPDELIRLVVPIYVELFTIDDLQQLNAFYDTPVGRKYIETLPSILQRSMAEGQKWGMRIAERVQARLIEKGFRK
jgi:uncharacterized protein